MLGLLPTLSLTHYAIALAIFAVLYYATSLARSDPSPLPPGPKGHWLIGNLLDMPRSVDRNLLARWKRTYGDMVYLKAFGYSILILNSPQAINDLLDKRGNIYSDRPVFVMAGELMGLGKSMGLINYGPEYKYLRKLTQHALNPDAVRKYYPIQEHITLAYMRSLLLAPHDFSNQLRLTIGRVVLAITYGLSVETADSEYIADAELTMTLVGKSTVPGTYLVDVFPWLKHLPRWLPFTTFLAEGAFGHRQIYNFVTRPFEHVKREIATGTAPPSFVADLLADNEAMQGGASEYDVEDGIKWAAGTMYGGGVETSFATVLTFFILMAQHPEEQARAQAELDGLVGHDRLARVQDRERLPYVRALITEVMRWHVVTPIGIARRTATDDVYMGYHIPKDTVVIPNSWGLSQLDNQQGPLDEFKPERFLDDNDSPMKPADYVFGYGRRICPGKALAENSLFLIIANTLLLFDIAPPAPGELPADAKMPADAQFSEYLVSCPEKFACAIRPRSGASAELIEQAWAAGGGGP